MNKASIRIFVNIFVGDEDIRDLQQEQTAVKEDTVVSIIPAIAGRFKMQGLCADRV